LFRKTPIKAQNDYIFYKFGRRHGRFGPSLGKFLRTPLHVGKKEQHRWAPNVRSTRTAAIDASPSLSSLSGDHINQSGSAKGKCGSSFQNNKNSTRLGQLRESTGEFRRSVHGTSKLTIKKLRPACFTRLAQYSSSELYSLMVLLI